MAHSQFLLEADVIEEAPSPSASGRPHTHTHQPADKDYVHIMQGVLSQTRTRTISDHCCTYYGLHPAWDNPKYPHYFFFLLFFYFCMINMFVVLPNSEVGNVHSGLRAKNIKATSWLLIPGLLSPHYSQNRGYFLQKTATTFVINSLFGHSD